MIYSKKLYLALFFIAPSISTISAHSLPINNSIEYVEIYNNHSGKYICHNKKNEIKYKKKSDSSCYWTRTFVSFSIGSTQYIFSFTKNKTLKTYYLSGFPNETIGNRLRIMESGIQDELIQHVWTYRRSEFASDFSGTLSIRGFQPEGAMYIANIYCREHHYKGIDLISSDELLSCKSDPKSVLMKMIQVFPK